MQKPETYNESDDQNYQDSVGFDCREVDISEFMDKTFAFDSDAPTQESNNAELEAELNGVLEEVEKARKEIGIYGEEDTSYEVKSQNDETEEKDPWEDRAIGGDTRVLGIPIYESDYVYPHNRVVGGDTVVIETVQADEEIPPFIGC